MIRRIILIGFALTFFLMSGCAGIFGGGTVEFRMIVSAELQNRLGPCG